MQNLDQDHISDFAGLGAAPMPRGSRDYINDGRYTAQITKVKKVRSTKPHEIDANGRGALMVIIELTIVEVLQHRVYMGRNEAGEMVEKESNAPGDHCSQVIKMITSRKNIIFSIFFSKNREFLFLALLNLSFFHF